jgi:glycosyltransferase involved in cell wall biosynthesis
MKILSISTDRKVFEEGSAVRARLIEYGGLVEELHVIVFAKHSLNLKQEKIAPNIYLYPTNSFSKFTHICAAISQARSLKRSGLTFDLVTTQDPFEAGIAGLKSANIFNAGLHIQIHTDFMSKYFAQESLLNRARVCIAKFVIPRANAIRVVSERIKNSLVASGYTLHPISVLPIFVAKTQSDGTAGPDLDRKYPQFDFRALVVARLAPEKNVASAIEAMASIIKYKPNAGLVIVGDGPERTRLEKLAAQLGITENVIFEGWRDNIVSYYKMADVLVLPSLYEGYGMVAAEAALAGCPVVMTDVGCAGNLIIDGQNGLVVPVGNTKALVGALVRIISGELKFIAKPLQLPTKQEYLDAYKKSWQDSVAKG